MILLVTYDLKQPVGSYAPFFEALKGEESWWHYIPSTWLVASYKSAKEFSSELTPLLFEGDRLLVTQMSGEHQGWLPRKAWDWIKKYK